MFDLTISTLSDRSGAQQDLPGLYIASAPRKAARLRAQDQLLVYMKVSGNASLSPAEQQEYLSKVADAYFTSSGPITSGLKAAITTLNDLLMQRNVRGAKEGQVIAVASVAALHAGTIMMAQAGATHTFVLGKDETQHFHDPVGGRSLGISHQAVPRFYQTSITPGDFLLFSASPSTAWSAKSLSGSGQLSMDHLRRRLMGQAGADHEGVVARVQNGKGKVNWFRPVPADPGAAETRRAEPSASQPAQPPARPQQRPTSFGVALPAVERRAPVEETPATGAPRPAQEEPARQPRRPAQAQPAPIEPQKTAEAPKTEPVSSARGKKEAPARAARPPHPSRPAGPNPIALGMSRLIKSISGFIASLRARMGGASAGLRTKVMPRQAEPLVNLSPAAMLFIAICVPLVVVAAAMAVYMKEGRSEEIAINLYNAQQAIDRAAKQTDPALQRESWSQAVSWLNEADKLGKTDAGAQLRMQAQGALDQLDGIIRLDFHPATTTVFGSEVNITRMVANANDVYLLDSKASQVLRLYRTGTGYDVDPNFICQKGMAGDLIIGDLIDLIPLAPNNEMRASIAAVDKTGNLLYCAPNQDTVDAYELRKPDTNLGQVTSVSSYEDMLYLLDPSVNAVWSYPGNNGIFQESPRLYFDKQVPRMGDVIDLAVDREYLYLLHANGEMTLCESSGFEFSPTHCTDPAPYGDPRAGRDRSPLKFDEARFAEMQVTSLADPSLYILDDKNNAVYHFSLRKLNFQRQYRAVINPDFPFPGEPATAFVVTPNRRVVMAFKNQVFIAQVP